MRRRTGLAALAAAALSACGFALRQPPKLQMQRIALHGFEPRTPLIEELRRQIAAGGSRVVESQAQADLVLEALSTKRDKVVAAQTAAGQVREFTLRQHLRFRARTPAGRVLIPETELMLSRDMSYNETDALAKEQEEAMLYRAMQVDIVDQLMRRLAALPSP
ncbi:LPS assembly lipoprotein LptE [Caldimonas sp. KR1-144]|uniref:LPS-assembly lipoprotein LptE n=1 Tax=Caldimonas sp. KR1-144 TaxID=3400911 RepID=UPI003C0C6045